MKKKIYILSFLFFIIDLISKLIVKKTLSLNTSIKIIPDFFKITYVKNSGAAFSILRDKQLLLIIIAILVLIGISMYIRKEKLTKLKIIYYSLLIGGIFGNLIDRIIYNSVIDFLDFKVFNIEAPIFNLADTFIFIAVVLIIIESIYGGLNGDKSFRRKYSS